ncbi:MAG: hypothetical protein V7637_1737 [Mycobacteriales bacterium]
MTESAGNSPVTRRHLLRAGAAAIPIVVLARGAGAAAAPAAPAPAAPASAAPAVENRRAARAGELVYFC